MTVAGIDYSTKFVDVALLQEDSDAATWHRYPLTGDTPFYRARSVKHALPTASWWEHNGVYLAAIEQAFSVTFNAATALARIQGAIAATLPSTLTMFETAPNEWQRVFLGLAPDEKLPGTRVRGARQAAYKRRAIELGFGDAPDLPFDAYAAFGIAHAARAINQQAVEAAVLH